MVSSFFVCFLFLGSTAEAESPARPIPTGVESQSETETAASEESSAEGVASPQRGRRAQHRNRGQGRRWQGRQQDEVRLEADHSLIMFLIENRDKIQRVVKQRDDGVETLTESDDKKVAKAIQEHVKSMYGRLESQTGIRMRDPLFRAIFSYTKQIDMEVELTDKGIHVRETSSNAYVVKLIQAHAQVVSLFVKNGQQELRQNHEVPK